MRAAGLLCAAFMLGGCASGGLPYRDFAASATPVAADSARLLVFRAADSPQYAVRSASLRIDDVAQVGLASGRFQVLEQPTEQALSRRAVLRAAREPTQLRQGSASALPSGR